MAADAVAAAREAAAALGAPLRAPPVPLDDCQRNIVENALAAPFAGVVDREFYPSLPEKAAVLLFTLAKSQACPDGNKRMALILVEAFLSINGFTLETSNAAIEAMIRTAEAATSADRPGVLAAATEFMATAIVPLTEETPE